jgi:hypothetical protein|tara:strand:+ start:1141 stop:1320 length:180 start_codon:yes stop_codon:yes gene_type:complete
MIKGGEMMKYVIMFFLAFIAGFLTMWFASMDDLGSDVVIFTSDEELQELCWNGLRKGEP